MDTLTSSATSATKCADALPIPAEIIKGVELLPNFIPVTLSVLVVTAAASISTSISTASADPTCGTNFALDRTTNTCKPIYSTPTRGCDPTITGDGLGCFGSGDWENPDGSSPGNSGPTGERGFLYQALEMFPTARSQDLLLVGRTICGYYARGTSDDGIENAMLQGGYFTGGEAVFLMQISQKYLC